MKLKALLLASAFAVTATFAQAALTSDALILDYQAQGYTTIEVKKGPTQIKVEAIKDGQKIEVIYDIETGAVLKTETGAANALDDIKSGVSVRERNRDFVRGSRSSSDDSNDDNSDDSNDDNDDDSNDDHGGNRHSDSDNDHDDDRSDDHGGDRKDKDRKDKDGDDD